MSLATGFSLVSVQMCNVYYLCCSTLPADWGAEKDVYLVATAVKLGASDHELLSTAVWSN